MILMFCRYLAVKGTRWLWYRLEEEFTPGVWEALDN